MNLLVTSSAPPDGGAGISAAARAQASGLVELGHRVAYASPTPDDRAFLDEFGLTHIPTDPDADPRLSAINLWQSMADIGIEGVVNNDNPVLQAMLPALSVPAVVVCHMDRRIVASLCRYNADWIDHLVCISSDMLGTMTRQYGFDLSRCSIVPNGVPDPGRPSSFEAPPSRPLRAVYSGGWDVSKGGPRLLASIERNPAAWARMRVEWFGHVPSSVQARLLRTGVISFRGQRPQAEFLAAVGAADVLLFPSAKEGCPMTVLEAMSHGVAPLVADGVGAMRWIVDNAQNGFVLPLDRWVNELPRLISHLEERRDVVERVRRAARASFERRYRAVHPAAQIARLIERPTVDRRRPKRSVELLAWHRPQFTPGRRVDLLTRIRYRTGWLARSGVLDLDGIG